MSKSDGSSRVTRRIGTKSEIRLKCQRATRGIIPRTRRRFANYKIDPTKAVGRKA